MFGRNAKTQRRLFNVAWLISVVALYGMVFSPVPATVSAHPAPSGWNVVGRNPSGTYPHLDWWNQSTQYADQVNVAKLQWNDLGRVIIGNTTVSGKTDVFVYDYSNCGSTTIGVYTPPSGSVVYGQIGFNRCLMSHPGGYLEVYGGDTPATSERRRRRTAVHEFGHAIGFAHPNTTPVINDDCDSVMFTPVALEAETCYQPKPHDVADMEALHPNA